MNHVHNIPTAASILPLRPPYFPIDSPSTIQLGVIKDSIEENRICPRSIRDKLDHKNYGMRICETLKDNFRRQDLYFQAVYTERKIDFDYSKFLITFILLKQFNFE